MSKLKMIVINDQVSCLRYHWDILKRKGLDFDIDREMSAKVALACYKPKDYNLMIIDASDDITLNNNQRLSEYWKEKNPNLIIVGTSVESQIINDELSKKLYDKRICIRHKVLWEEILNILKEEKLLREANN